MLNRFFKLSPPATELERQNRPEAATRCFKTNHSVLPNSDLSLYFHNKQLFGKTRLTEHMTEWNQILHEKVYSSEEPDDAIVTIADSLQKKATKSRILDLACGAGRHVIYMAGRGFETHGADISDEGLRLTRERLRTRRLTASLVKCDMNHLPYINSRFDTVVCMRAIYHQRFTGIQNTLSEIHRILRRNGFILADFLTKKTYSYGKGAEIEKGTFAETEGPEEGVLHHFADKQEINHLFRVFKTIDLTLREREVDGKLRSRWAVQAAK